MDFIANHLDSIKNLCELHNVKQLYAFGSVLNNNFNEQSDVDLLVEFDPIELKLYADNYFNFKFSLQKEFNRNIDLLEEKAIKNPIFKKFLNQQRKLIYGH